METAEIISKLNQVAPKTVLQKSRFGKSERPCIWVDAERLIQVAELLKGDPAIAMDGLESFSVAQVEEALVFTYFLRSSTTHEILVIRGSVQPKNAEARVKIPSVRHVWPIAAAMESENAELFGVDFQDSTGAVIEMAHDKLPSDWRGYPLRKDYVFPQEVYGILHVRPQPAGRGSHD